MPGTFAWYAAKPSGAAMIGRRSSAPDVLADTGWDQWACGIGPCWSLRRSHAPSMLVPVRLLGGWLGKDRWRHRRGWSMRVPPLEAEQVDR